MRGAVYRAGGARTDGAATIAAIGAACSNRAATFHGSPMSVTLLLLLLFGLVGAVMLHASLKDADPASWQGDEGPLGPYRIERDKGRVTRVRAGLDAPSTLAFELAPESGLHRAARNLGWATEIESGNARFDRTFHVLSDDPAVAAWLRDDPARGEALLALVDSAKLPRGYTFRHFTCGGGRLFADYAVRPGASAPAVLVAAVQERLGDLVPHLPPAVLGQYAPIDGMRRLVAIVWSACLLAFLSGTFVVQFLLEADFPQVIDTAWLGFLACSLFVGVAGPPIMWVWRRFRRTSRAVQGMFPLLFFGMPGMFCLVLAGTWKANMAFDNAPPQRVAARIVDVRTVKPLFRDARRYVTVERAAANKVAPGDMEMPWRIELDDPSRYRLPEGRVILVAHRGALGLRWVSNLRYE
jgi:hypothetical protein